MFLDALRLREVGNHNAMKGVCADSEQVSEIEFQGQFVDGELAAEFADAALVGEYTLPPRGILQTTGGNEPVTARIIPGSGVTDAENDIRHG